MPNNYVVFIISHGRADNVLTERTLKTHGYSGPVYFVIDNEDAQAESYRDRFGVHRVLLFNKKHYADLVDEGDNFDNRRTTTHARNACFDFAEQLGVERFLVLDDDYTEFKFRTNGEGSYPSGKWRTYKTLDGIFEAMFNFADKTKAATVCMAQGGDFIGGRDCGFAKNPTLRRKAMNSFFCSTKRRFWFRSRLNEDVNTYLVLGFLGGLFFTVPLVSLDQEQTQASEGGMSEAYLESGTYVKSFYSVMYCPSFVKISTMGRTGRRIHHRTNWLAACPQILSEEYRKSSE